MHTALVKIQRGWCFKNNTNRNIGVTPGEFNYMTDKSVLRLEGGAQRAHRVISDSHQASHGRHVLDSRMGAHT